MEYVYILMHSHQCEDDIEADDVKLLGVYSSESNAKAAIERYSKLEGFCKYPVDCFSIGRYKIDTDSNWSEGFVSWEEAEIYRRENNLCSGDEYKEVVDKGSREAQDYRLTNQKEYLSGKKLKRKPFRATPKSDHEHCVFCWDKFLDGDEGYCADNYYWICEKCYADFKDMFRWKVK